MDPILNDLLTAAANVGPCQNYPSSSCGVEGRSPNHPDASQRWCLSCLCTGLYGAFTALDVATQPLTPNAHGIGPDTDPELGAAPPATGPAPEVSPDTPLGGGPIGEPSNPEQKPEVESGRLIGVVDETQTIDALRQRLSEQDAKTVQDDGPESKLGPESDF